MLTTREKWIEAFLTCRACRFQTGLSAPTRWLKPQIESSKKEELAACYILWWICCSSTVERCTLFDLLIYLFWNRAPLVLRNHRGSCCLLANRMFWASLRPDRIWIYSALIIKHPPPQKKGKQVGGSPDKCWCCWLVLLACGAGDASLPCGQMAPGQGARVVSPSRADTCTNLKALAVRACKYHPGNLGDDVNIGNPLHFEIIEEILDCLPSFTASETTQQGDQKRHSRWGQKIKTIVSCESKHLFTFFCCHAATLTLTDMIVEVWSVPVKRLLLRLMCVSIAQDLAITIKKAKD